MSQLRRALLLSCTCLAIVTSLSAAPSDQTPVDPYVELNRANEKLSEENRNLKRRLTDLMVQNRVLERQLAQLKSRPAPAPNPPQPFRMPGSDRRPATPGSGWVPREFNGQTVYIVPCESGGGASPAGASKLATGTLLAPATRPAAE